MKILTFCLWGDIPRYNIGAIKNAQLALNFYSDFECWFYIHRPSVPIETVNELLTYKNVQIIFKYGDINAKRFMAWRFEALDDPKIELLMSRDTDTRILKKEVLAVREWLNSGKLFHIMRDHPCHYPKILGGMFGSKKIPGIEMVKEIDKFFTENEGKDDQDFLFNIIYPLIKDNCLIHDEIMLYEGSNCKQYPMKVDKDFNFIGGYVYEEEKREQWCIDRLRNHMIQNLSHRVQQEMSISYCLVACDLNLVYTQFYPLVKKCWEMIVGIPTKFILVADQIPDYLLPFKDDIILFNPVAGIPTAFQAQCIRILYPCLLKTSGGIIISDMDLIPLNKKFYIDSIQGFTTDDFIVYRDVISAEQEYPICFNLATPEMWKEIFHVDTEDDIRRLLKEWYVPDYSISHPYSIGWAQDQRKLFQLVNSWGKNVIRLTDAQTKFKRLDRSDMKDIESNSPKYQEKILTGEYSDFHLPHKYPYDKTILTLLEPVISLL